MVLKRKISINLENIQQEEQSENSPTPSILTPTGGKRFRRQLSVQNFSKSNEKLFFLQCIKLNLFSYFSSRRIYTGGCF